MIAITKNKLYFIFLALILIFSTIAGVNIFSVLGLSDSAFWRSHTWEVLAYLQELDADANAVEKSQAYYVLTGQATDYQKDIDTLHAVIDKLSDLTQDNQVQIDNIAVLRHLVDERLSVLNNTVKIRQTKGFEAARADLAERLTEVTSRVEIKQKMVDEENRLLSIRSVDEAFKLRLTCIVVVVSTLFGVVIIGFTFFTLYQEKVNAIESEQKLVLANLSKEKFQEELFKTNKELEQFAYITSHDLKAPLRAISNLATWIKEDLGENLTEDINKNLTLMTGRIHRMENLIEGVLRYSRVGRTDTDVTRTPTLDLVKDYIANIDTKKFKITVAKDLPVIVANRTALIQLFGNLISNSINHHNRDDGNVEIGWDVNGDMYEFWVKDDGPGIDPSFIPKLFQPFQTAKPRDVKESTGIGLALCRKIVEVAGGKIWVETTDGTKFIFSWPKPK